MLTKAFPRVKIVTSMIDPNLNKKKLWIEPGIGNFGGKNKPFTFSFFGSIVWVFFTQLRFFF